MQKLLDHFYRVLLWMGALFMIATLLAILLGIAGRQFGFDIPGLDGYAGYSIASALFLAAPAALRHGDHIRVSLLLDRLGATPRKLAEYWCLIAATGISAYFAWFAVRLVWISYTTHDIAQTADATPLWIPQLAMAIGSTGFAIAFLESLVLKLLDQERVVQAPAEMARVE